MLFAASTTQLPIETVLITAGGVVLAAIITAVAAHYRLKRRLDAERERLKDQLGAEKIRLDAQLEAEMKRQSATFRRERENDLRHVLLEATKRLTEAIGHVALCGRHPDSLSAEALAMLHFNIDQLVANKNVIAVHLGGSALESQRYQEALDSLDRARIMLAPNFPDAGEPPDMISDAVGKELVRAREAQQAFADATAERIGPDAGVHEQATGG